MRHVGVWIHVGIQLVARTQSEIDPDGTIARLSDLPVAVKYDNPGFMTAGRLLAVGDAGRTLYHARAFLNHTIGCNGRFTGTGLSPDGAVEMMALNTPLADIAGVLRIPLDVSAAAVGSALEEERARGLRLEAS